MVSVFSFVVYTALFAFMAICLGAPLEFSKTSYTGETSSFHQRDSFLTSVSKLDEASTPKPVVPRPSECSKCQMDNNCGSLMACYQNKCVKTGDFKVLSIAKCFPNLAECATCTEDKQCRLGGCYQSHCIQQKNPHELFKVCGVHIRGFHGYRWPFFGYGLNQYGRHVGGNPSHRHSFHDQIWRKFNLFKHSFGFK